MSIKFLKFPEVENQKERSALEFAWLERQQSEEQKKNQQSGSFKMVGVERLELPTSSL